MWKRVALLLLLGLVLLACNLQGQYLLPPYWLEELGRVLYKLTFFIVLPFRAIVCVLIPAVDHHWSLPHHVLTCMGTPFFLTGLAAGAREGVRRLRMRRPAKPKVNAAALERRQFMVRSMAGIVGIATGSVGGYASLLAPESVRLRRYDYPIAGLPRALDGLRIVHISDTHYGPFVAMPYLRRVFDQANGLEADLVLLTGDYVHYAPESVGPGIEVLGRLRARLGVVAVMGNHEHWEGTERCRAAFRSVGLPLVDNCGLYLTANGLREDAVAGQSIRVAGVGDLWEDEVSFEKALSGVPDDMPRLVLSHNPDAAELVKDNQRVDLMFSGHTHGGQISLPLIGAPISPSRLGDKYLGGACQGPRCPVVVSRGIGLAGIPLRFGVPPELGLITLHRA
ncbi:MAG: metallophosphoesterase [FCB group bacterium]|nr:metallophosphoesterase [FCB group bacterium]